MNAHPDAAYYVLSNGDAPEAIKFNLSDAMEAESRYIDVFDMSGEKLTAYWRLADGTYTDTF